MKVLFVSWLVLFALVVPMHGSAAEVRGDDAVTWNEARWIGYTRDDRTSPHVTRVVHPERLENPESRRTHVSPLMRKTFKVDRDVHSARLQVCGLGFNELYLNGKKVGDQVLSPAPTSYDKLSLYTVHDVTANLRKGQNALGLWLGNGFYGQNFGFNAQQLHYGKPRAKLLLTIEYRNGKKQQIVTDSSWKAAQSPILFDNLYGGETYDARLALPKWSEPEFKDADWKNVEMMDAPAKKLVGQRLEPIRKVRSIRPVAVLPAENGEWILDLGENIAGWVELNLDEPRGTEIQLRFAELLMPGGKAIDTASTGIKATGCEQIDIYICKGSGETWEPRFTYHGFRYVQIKGLSNKPELDDFTGWFVRTDLKRIGSFECSDPLINTFYEVSLRTIEGNLHGLLSDCPHRERCAWLGDMHASAEVINMNYAASPLWQKHVADFGTTLGASYLPKQHYPADDFPEAVDPRSPSNIACGRRLCGQARPDWGVAMVLVPWYNWLYFGDRETAANSWEMMVDYMQFLQEVEVRDNLIKEGYAYGDWCAPDSKQKTPPQLSASILYVRSLRAMAQMAKLLGKDGEERIYAERAETVRQAINQRFFNSDQSHYGTQAATAMALQDRVVPAGKQAAVAAGLNHMIMERDGGAYTTGIMGHRPLYTVLNDYGFSATTEALWQRMDYPSLAYMTEKHGLTTWPESNHNFTEGSRYGSHSFNHPMQSGFAVTFHESIGGIRPDPEHPGFEQFFLKPCFMEGLDWAAATYDSVRGAIVSKWRKGEDRIQWDVIVPEGATAEVRLPFDPAAILKNGKSVRSTGKAGAYNRFSIQAGKHRFDIKMTGNKE